MEEKKTILQEKDKQAQKNQLLAVLAKPRPAPVPQQTPPPPQSLALSFFKQHRLLITGMLLAVASGIIGNILKFDPTLLVTDMSVMMADIIGFLGIGVMGLAMAVCYHFLKKRTNSFIAFFLILGLMAATFSWPLWGVDAAQITELLSLTLGETLLIAAGMLLVISIAGWIKNEYDFHMLFKSLTTSKGKVLAHTVAKIIVSYPHYLSTALQFIATRSGPEWSANDLAGFFGEIAKIPGEQPTEIIGTIIAKLTKQNFPSAVNAIKNLSLLSQFTTAQQNYEKPHSAPKLSKIVGKVYELKPKRTIALLAALGEQQLTIGSPKEEKGKKVLSAPIARETGTAHAAQMIATMPHDQLFNILKEVQNTLVLHGHEQNFMNFVLAVNAQIPNSSEIRRFNISCLETLDVSAAKNFLKRLVMQDPEHAARVAYPMLKLITQPSSSAYKKATDLFKAFFFNIQFSAQEKPKVLVFLNFLSQFYETNHQDDKEQFIKKILEQMFKEFHEELVKGKKSHIFVYVCQDAQLFSANILAAYYYSLFNKDGFNALIEEEENDEEYLSHSEEKGSDSSENANSVIFCPNIEMRRLIRSLCEEYVLNEKYPPAIKNRIEKILDALGGKPEYAKAAALLLPKKTSESRSGLSITQRLKGHFLGEQYLHEILAQQQEITRIGTPKTLDPPTKEGSFGLGVFSEEKKSSPSLSTSTPHGATQVILLPPPRDTPPTMKNQPRTKMPPPPVPARPEEPRSRPAAIVTTSTTATSVVPLDSPSPPFG